MNEQGRESCMSPWIHSLGFLLKSQSRAFHYNTIFTSITSRYTHTHTHMCISSVQLLSHVQLFATPRTAANEASLFITNYWSLLKLMSIHGWWYHPTISSSAVPLSSCLQSFPASESFSVSQFFASGGQSIGVSDSASVLQMNIQDWFPLGWTGWISLQSKGLSRVFSITTI